MTTDIVVTERVGPVLRIVMNRPPANAINREMSRAIYAALRELQDDGSLTVGVITGTGERIFSGGWDLKEAADQGLDPDLDNDPEKGFGPGGFAGITEFWDLDKPVIAAVNGAAVGGGFEIVLSCDVVIMADHAFYALPEMQRGILADGGAVQKLPRRIPYNVAVELLLTGRRLEAEEAVRWGLAHKAVPADRLEAEAMALAEQVARSAPLALRALKEALQFIDAMSVREAMTRLKGGGGTGLACYDRIMGSEDALEGARAYAEKREPIWKGR
ncbi:MAG: enoyl-CoA hydratase-related protein [Kiloniellales bacterium]